MILEEREAEIAISVMAEWDDGNWALDGISIKVHLKMLWEYVQWCERMWVGEWRFNDFFGTDKRSKFN